MLCFETKATDSLTTLQKVNDSVESKNIEKKRERINLDNILEFFKQTFKQKLQNPSKEQKKNENN